MAAFTITTKHLEAARLLANGLTPTEVADQMGIGRRTLYRWSEIPSFKQEIEKFVEADRKAIENQGIANKQCRLDEYNRRWKKMQALIDARAEWGSAQGYVGGDTGLLCQDYKGTVEVYKVDAALLREMRELEKQAAIEAGQWVEKSETLEKVDVSKLSDEELKAIAEAKS